MALKIGDTFIQGEKIYKVYGYDSQGRALASCEDVEGENNNATISDVINSEIPSNDGDVVEEETQSESGPEKTEGVVVARRRKRSLDL